MNASNAATPDGGVCAVSDENPTLTLLEAAKFLKIHRTTLLERAASGEVPGARLGRAWVFRRVDLERYLAFQVNRQTCRRRRHLWPPALQAMVGLERSEAANGTIAHELDPGRSQAPLHFPQLPGPDEELPGCEGDSPCPPADRPA